jgi:hypothetical protein
MALNESPYARFIQAGFICNLMDHKDNHKFADCFLAADKEKFMVNGYGINK